MIRNLDKLGKPDLEVAGLQIWIHGRQYPNETDYWDGNWLNVTIRCHSKDSQIWTATGPDLHASQFKHLKDGLESMLKTSTGKAELDAIEPNLSVRFEVTSVNEIEMKVDITPNQVFEHHQYLFYPDARELQRCVVQLDEILGKYPLRGKPED